MASQVFTVLTEFRFDIAHAVAESKTLQNEVGKISDAADAALSRIKHTGLFLAGQMGVGVGSTLAFINAAIQGSEKFAQSQRNLSNILLQNADVLGLQGMSFNQAMKNSSAILENIRHKAQDFALDPNELLSQTKAIAPILISHQLDNAQMGRSIDIARGLLKSAPTLGVDPGLVQFQLQELVLGRADAQNTLFNRLVSETKPFREAGVTNGRAYNMLDPKKRIDLLSNALLQFGSNADVISGNVNSLNGQLTRFRSLLYGQFSIFTELGQAIIDPLKKLLKQINDYLDKNGKQIVSHFASIVRQLFQDPVKLVEQLMQISRLQGDVKKAAGVLSLIGALEGLYGLMNSFKAAGGDIRDMNTFSKAFKSFHTNFAANLGTVVATLEMIPKDRAQVGIRQAISNAMAVIFGTGGGALLPSLGEAIGFVVGKVLLPLAALIFMFQALSRGISVARVEDMKWIAAHAEQLARVGDKLVRFFRAITSPISLAIDGLGALIGWLFSFGYLSSLALSAGEGFLDFLMYFAKLIVGVFALISGVLGAVLELYRMIIQLDYSKFLDNLITAFVDMFDEIWKRFFDSVKGGNEENPVSQTKIDIGKVEINNQFKEQMEPDRIAFTLTNQLLKVATNPSQAVGRSRAANAIGG